MFSCCNQSKSQTEMLKERVEEMTKQINNIYELLEALTNESKNKYNLNESNSNVSEKTDEQPRGKAYFLDKKSV